MKRRTFLGVAAGGAGLLAVPAAFASTPRFREVVARVVRRELDYLTHDPAGLARFADEYFAGADAQDRLKLRLIYRLGRRASESWTVNDMVEQYLLGSDFFSRGMDESRVVTFARLHSPWQGGCSNPFAAVYHPRA